MVKKAIKRVTVLRNEKLECWDLVGLGEDLDPIQTLGSDYGEPEDKMLVRNLSWVENLVQELLDEREELRARLNAKQEERLECNTCGEKVRFRDIRDHLGDHHPAAWGFEYDQVLRCFKPV